MFNALVLGKLRQPHHGGHIEDMMVCDHPSFVKIVILVIGELWHFQLFPTWRTFAILNWNFVILDYVGCGVVVVVERSTYH